MEYLQGNQCIAILNKNGAQEGRTVPVWGVGTSDLGEDYRKGVGE
jgi:hypothetical protein